MPGVVDVLVEGRFTLSDGSRIPGFWGELSGVRGQVVTPLWWRDLGPVRLGLDAGANVGRLLDDDTVVPLELIVPESGGPWRYAVEFGGVGVETVTGEILVESGPVDLPMAVREELPEDEIPRWLEVLDRVESAAASAVASAESASGAASSAAAAIAGLDQTIQDAVDTKVPDAVDAKLVDLDLPLVVGNHIDEMLPGKISEADIPGKVSGEVSERVGPLVESLIDPKVQAAAGSASAAADSASAAAGSATAASGSATAASGSATAAATAAGDASASAGAAANSEGNAVTAAGEATSAASTATGAASAAAGSASSASLSAGAAGTAESNAKASETAAAGSASNAASSAGAAAGSATAAASSATAAGSAKTAAEQAATAASGSKDAAATSATNAANSATSAGTSASNASTSAGAAGTEADRAKDEADRAEAAAATAELPVSTAVAPRTSGASAGVVTLIGVGETVTVSVRGLVKSGLVEHVATVVAGFESDIAQSCGMLEDESGGLWLCRVTLTQILVLGPPPSDTVLNGTLVWSKS